MQPQGDSIWGNINLCIEIGIFPINHNNSTIARLATYKACLSVYSKLKLFASLWE